MLVLRLGPLSHKLHKRIVFRKQNTANIWECYHNFTTKAQAKCHATKWRTNKSAEPLFFFHWSCQASSGGEAASWFSFLLFLPLNRYSMHISCMEFLCRRGNDSAVVISVFIVPLIRRSDIGAELELWGLKTSLMRVITMQWHCNEGMMRPQKFVSEFGR